MAQLLVRDLDDNLVARLKQRAARNNRSVEAEHRALLEQALGPDIEELKARLLALQEETRGRFTDSAADLIRLDRDSR